MIYLSTAHDISAIKGYDLASPKDQWVIKTASYVNDSNKKIKSKTLKSKEDVTAYLDEVYEATLVVESKRNSKEKAYASWAKAKLDNLIIYKGSAGYEGSVVKEYEELATIAKKIKDKLEVAGYRVVIGNKPGDLLSTKQRALDGNDSGASLHLYLDMFSGYSNKNYSGAYFYSMSTTTSNASENVINKSTSISKVLLDEFTKDNNGIYRTLANSKTNISLNISKAELNYSIIPAVYMYLGFIDSNDKATLINDSVQDEMATKIVKGITKALPLE